MLPFQSTTLRKNLSWRCSRTSSALASHYQGPRQELASLICPYHLYCLAFTPPYFKQVISFLKNVRRSCIFMNFRFLAVLEINRPAVLQDSLPPSVRESIQNVLANGAFFQHSSPVVMLPPPIGLFPNLKPTMPSAAVSADNHLQVFHTPLPSQQLGKNSTLDHGATTSNAPNSMSTTNKRQHPSSSCSETDSDDGKSQCSTASYDGSQRSQGKPNEVESAAKKRTWKVLLTSEQACEVLSFLYTKLKVMFLIKFFADL